MKSNISRRIFALLLTLAMILTLVPTVFADNQFTDVPEDQYFYEPVMWAVENGITQGTGNGKFSPNQTCTRGQVVTFLWRANGEPEPASNENPFNDVKADDYFFKAVLWAVEKEVTNGTDPGKFSPNAKCTRGQVVTFLWRASDKPEPASTENPFNDVKADDYFFKAVLWAVEQEITNGTDPGKFSPNAKCTRGQVVTFLYRALAEKPLPDMTGKTVILHTNDTHGALMGFAQVAAVKAKYEAAGAEVILVDAGDFSQGTTYVSTNKGEAAITAMNAAGYDFVTLGNHEFDFGYAQLMANLEKAEFTALCADVYNKTTGELILPAYAIKEVGGVKVGFFGMETPETQTKVNPGLITEISFGTNENGKFVQSAKDAIAALKEGGADIIIGLVHLGVDDESIGYRSIDLYPEIKDDVDFLIDGHSHTVMTEGPNGEPIQSTGTKASKTAFMNVGLIQIDNETKTIEDNYLIPLGENAPTDEAVAAVANEIMSAVDAEYGAVFAQSEVELNGDKAPGNRNMETNLGDLITDSMRWSVLKDMDAETLGVPEENVVAITNGGGIRAWIHKGDVTMNDVNTVLPFGNTVAVVYVTGAELLEALEASTYCTPTAVGGFPQVSGMQFTINTGKAFNEGDLYPGSTYHAPLSIQRVTINEIGGKPFDPEATYAVVTNNFCAAGGDTYYAFKAASAQFDTGIPMDEALMDYIKTELNAVIGTEYADPQGRIIIKEATNDFVLAEPQNGDEVVIYNAGHGLAIKNETDNDWYLMGSEVTPDDAEHKIVDPAEDIVWKVASDGNGMYRFTNGENAITCWVSGNYLELTNKADYEGGVTDWALVEADADTYSYYIKNWSLSGQYGPGWLEFYTKNDATKLSCYSTSEDRLSLENFGFQFYVKGAEYVEPGPGPQPPQPGENGVFVKVTEEQEDWSGTYVFAHEGDSVIFDGKSADDNNYVAVTIADNQIVAFLENAITVEKSGEGYTFKTAEGKYMAGKIYQDAGSNGMYLQDNAAVGSIAWVDGAPVVTSDAGTVLRFNNKTYTDATYHWFRFFTTTSSVTTDANTAIAIYKLDPSIVPPEPGVNTGALQHAIEAAEALNPAEFTEESYAAVAEALAAAKAVMAKEDKTQEEVDAATAALNAALDALEKIELPPVEGEFTLTNALVDGAMVVIYHPTSGMALSNADLSESQTNYRAGVAITPEDDKIVNPEAAIVWTVKAVEGGFTLADQNGKLLACTGNNLLLGETNTVWEVRASEVEGAINIVNVNAPAGSSGDPRAMEWFAKYSEYSCYYLTSSSTDFALQIFSNEEGEPPVPVVNKTALQAAIDAAKALDPAKYTEESFAAVTEALGAAEAVLANEDATQEEVDAAAKALNDAIDALEKVPGEGEEYVLANVVKDGDQVVIYNPDSGKAISDKDSDAASYPERYRLGVDVAPTDSKITDPSEDIVWTVEVTENGIAFKDADGKYLSVPANYANLVLDSDCKYWTATESDGLVFLISTESAGSSGDLRGIEYFQGKFTTYYASEQNLTNSRAAFGMELYVKGEAEPAETAVTVLYTNDIHCGVDQSETSIGVAGLAKVKKELAAEGTVALVDCGDAIQGEIIGTISKGEYLVKLLNYVGYDYATFGNHEFDYTMPQLKKLVGMADYEYLSCNFKYLGEDAEGAVDVAPYAIVDYNGLKVAYVGIATPESLVKSTPTYFQNDAGEWIYTFCQDESGAALYAAVQEAVDAAKAEGADVVVAIAHLGIDEQSSPWTSREVIANTTGIDVLLDGHSHSTIEKEVVANKEGKDVLLSQTGTKLANIGKLTIMTDGSVDVELIRRADVDGVDADTQAYLDEINAEFEALKKQVVAHVDYDLLTTDPATGTRMVRTRETNLGDVCADAYRIGLGADIAFVNGGGVRANIEAGDVTYEQIIKVHPYSNMACMVEATGQQILDALEMSVRNVNMDDEGKLSGENGGFLQVSGLKFTADLGIEPTVVVDENKMFVEVAGARRVKDVQVLQADGTYAPLDPEATYTLASHNYMLKQCGDGINMFKNDKILLDEVKVDNQVLIEYMTGEEFAAHDYSNWEGEDRITYEKNVVPDYVLCGWINGAACSDEEDWENPSPYVFEDGKLTATFTEDSYVWVKLSDNSTGWKTDGYVENETSAVFYNYNVFNKDFNKMKVPGGVELEFTLVDNGDDTLTLSYAAVEPEGYPVLENGSNMLKYGHIDLDVPVADFLEDFALGDIVTVTVNGFTFDAPVVTNYDDVDTGEYLIRCAAGKTVTTLAINYGQIGVVAGIIELAPEGSASKYQLVEGLEWPMYATIELKEAQGYADELAIRKLNRTNNREDYPDLTDAEFANFRAVSTTGFGENVLYRSSSPISDEIGRNTYADAAAEAAGIKIFVNLADTQAEAEAYAGYADTYYSTQTIKFLGLPVAFTTDEFKAGLAEGYRFIAANKGPYMIHCLEGKDRTGLSVGVLEALMGASLAEIQADYLKTYENYFDVQNGAQVALTDAQKDVLKGIITKNLGIIFDAELETADLAAEAEAYLKEIGLNDEEIAALKVNLAGGEEPEGVVYTLVTEEPADWTGNYLIAYSADGTDAYVFNGNEEVNGYVAATIEDNKIVFADGMANVEIAAMEGGYSLKVANGYMYGTPSANALKFDENEKLATIALDDDGNAVITSDTTIFRFNNSSSQLRFRFYKPTSTSMPLVQLYKLTSGDAPAPHVHTWNEGVVDPEPSCTEAGTKTYTCTECGATKTETVAALGHDWGDWTVTLEPTETEAGEKTRTCGRCSATETEAIPATGGEEPPVTGSYYVKVTATEDLTAGKYLIVYETDAVAFDGSRTDKLDAGNNVKAVTITEGKIAADGIDFYFEYDGDGTFTSASGLNLGHSTAANGMNGTGKNTVSIDADGNVVIQGEGGYYLRFNKTSGDNNYRFRYYAEGKQQPIAIYKLVEG